ncbi:hypothetical protein FSP39_008553 [Pinctada imbricata]|uniref:Dendritic cell-specific transmembrane protein-like domain-containing protein n=1 Tax=Pinctada imbricata TaxID=66713 RepID=A0AA89BZ53_PINIB|nr:hypothetical protein FSP39_008553 [Pinctada imbricata]
MNSAKDDCKKALDSLNPIDKIPNPIKRSADMTRSYFHHDWSNMHSRKSETKGIQNQDKTGAKANKQKPPPYEKKRTPGIGVRPGAQEEHKRGVCDVLSVGNSVCNIGSSLTAVCNPFTYLKNKLKAASEAMLTALGYVTAFFKFEVKTDFGISGTVNYSKNASTVLNEVKRDILSRISWILNIFSTISNVLGLTLIILFVKSLLYIKKYRTKDRFDNIYITQAFVDFDEDCKKRGEEFVLPLVTKEEAVTYVITTTKRLSPAESRTLNTDIRIVLIHVLISTLTIGFDYVLYYALFLVTKYSNVALTVEGISTIDVNVGGNGIFAVVLRAMVDNLNLNSTFSVDLNFTCCLPNPSYPDISNIPVLLLLYAIAIFFVVMQGYGMRLRRKIASSFYPEQEVCRIHYLHEKIIHQRLTFKTWLKDLVFSRRKENEVRERISLRAVLAYRSPFFAKYIEAILPDKRSCLSCDKVARRGMIFKKCDNKSCNALYCEDCFKFIKGHCLVCDTKKEISSAQKKNERNIRSV